MIHVTLPAGQADKNRRLPFFLAMEEWVARCLPPREYFFTWIVNPTVIIGRNQDINTEVDREYCQAHGIEVVRRRSGGGCVYADRDNIMLSYISPGVDVVTTFGVFTGAVVDILRGFGINAEATGRNDIVVDGRKISGNAFYHLQGRSIVHGTMLYDTDLENMVHAITPSRAKLESKQVRSVESRITTVRNLAPDMTLEDFRRALTDGLATETIVLADSQIAEIEAIERRYYDKTWLDGRRSVSLGRIEGVGEIGMSALLDSEGRIASVDVSGDVFVLRDLDNMTDLLRGCCPDVDAIEQAIANIDVGNYIVGLTNRSFAHLLAESVKS